MGVVFLASLTFVSAGPPPNGWPTTRTVTAVLRDFHGRNEQDCNSRPDAGKCEIWPAGCEHPDFEDKVAFEENLVETTLGADRLPVFRADKVGCSSCTITSVELANMWYRTQPEYLSGSKKCKINEAKDFPIDLVWSNSKNAYVFEDNSFWPLSGELFLNYPKPSSDKNFHFTMELHTSFTYTGDESFKFTGDDDVWVFVNNQLVIDLGGVHGAMTRCVSLKSNGGRGDCADNGNYVGNKASALGLVVGETYHFDFFFAERHQSQSNCVITTNFPLNECTETDACGVCGGDQLVDVCAGNNAPDCGNGECVCSSGGCQCSDGWVSSDEGNCDSFCGNDELEPAEECDDPDSDCCNTDTCEFYDDERTCSGAPDSVCYEPICDPANGQCGVPRDNINGEPIVCSNAAVPGEPCSRYVCQADGSCGVGDAEDGTDCASDLCIERTCQSGTCVETPLVSCDPANDCFFAGTCNPATGLCSTPFVDEGVSCGAEPTNPCKERVCDGAGSCNLINLDDGTDCGSEDECFADVCLDGTCTRTDINTGSLCGSGGAAGQCVEQRCSAGACTALPADQGEPCSGSGETDCLERFCNNGECALLAVHENEACALSGGDVTDCTRGVCTAGTCAVAAATQGASCSSGTNDPSISDPNPCVEYICVGTECLASNIREGVETTACGAPGTPECQTAVCLSGVCGTVATNVDGHCTGVGETGECTQGQCQPDGSCALVNLTPDLSSPSEGMSCGADFGGVVDACSPFVCRSGTCTNEPVDCTPAVDSCFDSGVCTGGTCDYTIKPSCLCGNGTINGAEECDTGGVPDPCCTEDCLFEPDTKACGVVDECRANYCSGTSLACEETFMPAGTTCTTRTTDECNDVACDGLGECVFVALTGQPCGSPNECQDAVCGAGTATTRATCQVAPKAGSPSCVGLTAPECQKAVCDSGACTLVFDDAAVCSSLSDNDCNVAVCDSGLLTCVYEPRRSSDADPDIACTLPDGESAGQCNTAVCGVDGSCGLQATPDVSCVLADVVTDGCSVPVCNADGLCQLSPLADGTDCTISAHPECETTECQAGVCVAVSVRQSDSDPAIACSTISSTACRTPECSIDGRCVLVDVPERTTAACSAFLQPDDVCSEFVCSLGNCTRVPLAAGAACTDDNLCDVDTCDGAHSCTHVPTDVAVGCAAPLHPCSSSGTCNTATGQCDYTIFAEGTVCTPETPDPAGCRYFTCDAAAECTKGCVDTAVCGNGVVETGEDCDYVALSSSSACCTTNCTWFADLAPCNNTGRNETEILEPIPKGRHQFADTCIVDFCTAEHQCVSEWDVTINKCALGASSSNDSWVAGVAAGVAVAAAAALAIAVIAGAVFVWRLMAADKSWMEEFKDEHKGMIEQNAAFKGKADAASNPAFGLGADQ